MQNNISIERRRIRMSQAELARLLGFKTTRTISRMESGRTMLTDAQLVKLASIFGCTVDYLLKLSDNRKPMLLMVAQTTKPDRKADA